MKKQSRNFIIFFSILLILGCNPISIISYKSSLSKPDDYTEFLSYYLPKTYLKIKVPIEKKVLKEGKIHKIKDSMIQKSLKEYFMENYNWTKTKEPDEKFGIGKKIQFIPITVPDEDKHYRIAYKNAKVFAQTLNIKLNKDGIISSGEFAQENKTFEYVSKTVELGANVLGKLYALGKSDDSEEEIFPFKEKMISDVELEIKNEKDNVKKQQYLKKLKKIQLKFNTPEFRRIEVLADELQGLVNSRSEILLVSQSGVTKDAIEFRSKAIDKRIEKIKDEIMGTEKKTIYWISFLYEPNKPEITIFELDHKTGIIVPNSKTTSLSYINEGVVKNKKKLSIKSFRISPKISDNNSLTRALKDNPSDKSGFLRYNLPVKYTLQLFWDNKPLRSYMSTDDKKGKDLYSMYFPQFGSEGVLPGDFKDANIVYYEDIGAIKEIKYSKIATANASEVQKGFVAIDSLISLKSKINEIKEAKKSIDNEEDTQEVEETIIRLIIQDDDTLTE